jgi:hypothetical protein
MPAAYEAMRDKFIASGMGAKAAKTKAAKIYNSRRKPGGPKLHGKRKRSPKAATAFASVGGYAGGSKADGGQ